MSAAITLDDVLEAQESCESAQAAFESAIARRADVIRRALTDGVGATSIADALNVSRQRVYQMSQQRNPYRSQT